MSASTTWVHETDAKWYVIDVADKPLGRAASVIAHALRGKNKVLFAPHADLGDFVVVINAGRVKLTGDKLNKKHAYSHSGYPGGFRSEPYRLLLQRAPERALEKAVRGMLPKSPLGRSMLKKLKVYAEAKHPHAAQKPTPLAL